MASNVVVTVPKTSKGKSSFASPKINIQDAAACELAFEKCADGFRISCCCDDYLECTEMQSLCEAICHNDCSCCCIRDGIQVCNFNLCCGQCKCESTDNGCCITCRNAKCGDVLKAICECLECCCQNGCCCYICFGDKCCCFGGCNS